MVRAIVDHVAALAQALDISQPVIARVMVEMRRRQDDASSPHPRSLLKIGPSRRPAAAVAPGVTRGIEPASVGQTVNRLAVGPSASLANTVGALETYAATDLRPVAGIKSPHLRLDRHRYRPSRQRCACSASD